MSNSEISEFYDRQVAGMSLEDQLRLAGQIIERVASAQGDPLAGADPATVLSRQRAALKRADGMFQGPRGDSSLRHDEIVYGESEP